MSLGCPGRSAPGRGHSQGWVLQGKGENLQGCSAQGQTPDRLPHGERKDPGHCTPGRRSQGGAVMRSCDTSVVLQVPLCHAGPEPPESGASPGDPAVPRTQPSPLPACCSAPCPEQPSQQLHGCSGMAETGWNVGMAQAVPWEWQAQAGLSGKEGACKEGKEKGIKQPW